MDYQCELCGNSYDPKNSSAGNPFRFCCSECQDFKEDRDKIHQCELCDDIFYEYYSGANNQTRFCCRECQQEFEERAEFDD